MFFSGPQNQASSQLVCAHKVLHHITHSILCLCVSVSMFLLKNKGHQNTIKYYNPRLVPFVGNSYNQKTGSAISVAE